MQRYRAYIVGQNRRFQKAVPLACVDDDEATEKAKRLVDGHDVELWQRERKIATFDRKPKIEF